MTNTCFYVLKYNYYVCCHSVPLILFILSWRTRWTWHGGGAARRVFTRFCTSSVFCNMFSPLRDNLNISAWEGSVVHWSFVEISASPGCSLSILQCTGRCRGCSCRLQCPPVGPETRLPLQTLTFIHLFRLIFVRSMI